MVALIWALATLLVPTPPAGATSSLLCLGFTGCARSGYSSFGYGPTNYNKMWWRMYSGHNCTNYMAYRMIQSGMPLARPWSSSGDARYWGVVFKSRTNQTPLVGSVAWWDSNHVAYVQRIIDANTIIISEDHYGGDFDWRKIVRSGGGWPTGFIHLEDESVTPTAPPTVIGTPQVDAPLAIKPGTWNRTGATYKYQWLANGVAITGATTTTYTPAPAEVGDAISVKVTAAKIGYRTGSSTATAPTRTIPGVMTDLAAPVLSGFVKVGGVLSASTPTWNPAPTAITYAWTANGTPVPGATTPSLKLGPALLGKVVRVIATATRDGYTTTTSTSDASVPVAPEKLDLTSEPRVVGTPHVGVAYSVIPGVVGPAGVRTSYQWLLDGVPITGATTGSYTPSLTDPGHMLSVQVSYTKPGYTPIVRTLAAIRAVKSNALIRIVSRSHRSVTVIVTAGGVRVVNGVVTISDHRGQQTVTLVNGQATISPDWLYAGPRVMTVSYLGSHRVEAASLVRTVDIR
ncbi:MAG: hypothetical protein JWQ32_1906 [Marmoricola sp.]|nr:hypothetical protein [Marmoricola sp.]